MLPAVGGAALLRVDIRQFQGTVDDVVQESYLRLWKVRAAESVRSAKGFLFQIARCVARDAARRHRRSPVFPVADLGLFEVPALDVCSAEAACREEELELLADAIDTLPPRCREIMILRKLQRGPKKEIAALLGISEQTVQVQVLKGMKRCADFFRRRQAGGRRLMSEALSGSASCMRGSMQIRPTERINPADLRGGRQPVQVDDGHPRHRRDVH